MTTRVLGGSRNLPQWRYALEYRFLSSSVGLASGSNLLFVHHGSTISCPKIPFTETENAGDRLRVG